MNIRGLVIFSTSLLTCVCGNVLYAAEEALNLDNEQASTTQQSTSTKSGLSLADVKLMGRVDLTNELSPYNPNRPNENDKFKTYHMLLFVKANPSKKVDFMGEVITKAFYEIKYSPTDLTNLRFGKIIVPFGDTKKFHHFYGGIQGYGPKGVLFPNIWAENGLSLSTEFKFEAIDLYWISGISAAPNSNPDFSSASIVSPFSRCTFKLPPLTT